MKKNTLLFIFVLTILLSGTAGLSLAAEQGGKDAKPTPVVPTQSQRDPNPAPTIVTPTPYIPSSGNNRPVTPTPTPEVQATPTPTPVRSGKPSNQNNSDSQNNSDNGQSSQNTDTRSSQDNQQGVLSLTSEDIPSFTVAVPYTVPQEESISIKRDIMPATVSSTTEDEGINAPKKGLFLFAESQNYYNGAKLSQLQTNMLLALAVFFMINGVLLIKPRFIWRHFMAIHPLRRSEDGKIMSFLGDGIQGVKGGKSEHVIFYPLKDL